jgi:hypothetical protein
MQVVQILAQVAVLLADSLTGIQFSGIPSAGCTPYVVSGFRLR